MFTKKAIGIDLGTSKCCVGILCDGKVKILENEHGNKTTPSYVVFTDTERRVGENAKNHSTLNPANTVFSVKRIIGREWEDSLVTAAVNKMPYTIKMTSKKETCIRVSYKEKVEHMVPQQITAMLLGQMKDLAEHHLKGSVDEAVISVPASFSNAQRQATKDAAAIAGLTVLALINEPTAAAIAYQANRRETKLENIAVVDFGAGKFDVAIVTVCRGQVFVRAVHGSTAIGGDDIDEILMKYVRKTFKDEYGQKLIESPAMTERLRSSCEKLKRKLTLLPRVQDKLDCFDNDTVLPVILTRDDLKSLLPSEMQSSMTNILRRAMDASRIPHKNISRVILVGGSSRIPLFQTRIEDFFGPNLLDKSVNPDEAVAYGATLCAALLSGDHELEEFKFNDAFSHSYYFENEGESSKQVVFDQNSSKNFPQQRMYRFNKPTLFNESTKKQNFKLYEELLGQNNPLRLIGTLCLDEELRQSTLLFTNVMFKIDCCGIFNAAVQITPNPHFANVLQNYAGKLNKDELEKFTVKEQKLKKDDQDERERVEAMSDLEALSCNLPSAMINSIAEEFFPGIVNRIRSKAKETLEWLDVNKTRPKEDYVFRQNELKKLKNDLDDKIRPYEEEEEDRLAAETNLKSYCSSFQKLVDTGMVDDTKLFAPLSKLLEEAIEWLKSSKRPSKKDCDDRTNGMKNVHADIEKRLEIKRQENERLAAVDDLQKCLSKLQYKKFEGEEFDFVHRDVECLTIEIDRSRKYISESESPCKSVCDGLRKKLEKMVCDVEKQVGHRRACPLQ